VVSGVRRLNEVNARLARLVPGWVTVFGGYTISICNKPTRSTQPCIPSGSLNRVPASAGVRAAMSPLPGGRQHCVIPCGMWVPVAVWQPCELLYTCYLLTYFPLHELHNVSAKQREGISSDIDVVIRTWTSWRAFTHLPRCVGTPMERDHLGALAVDRSFPPPDTCFIVRLGYTGWVKK